MSSQLKALKTTDLSFMIHMSNLMVPRMLNGFLPKLDEKQRKAFDKVMPVEGGKKIYIHLVGTPTPPIVIEMRQPLKIATTPESDVRQQQIKGLRLNPGDIQALTERRIARLLWRLKGQIGSVLSISGIFMPFVLLGPRELKDMQQKAKIHFKPVLDLMPH